MFCVYTCLQYYAIIAIIVECDSLHSVVVGRVTNQTLTKYGRLNCGLSFFFFIQFRLVYAVFFSSLDVCAIDCDGDWGQHRRRL